MTYFNSKDTHCPVELSLQIINRKWVLQIICDMFFGKTRFSEFKKGKADLSNKALSRCLKYMEEQNLIVRVVNKENQSDIEYFLTDKEKSLNRILYDLVIFTLDDEDNRKYYSEDTRIETERMFREKLNID